MTAIKYSNSELQWIKDNQKGVSRKELTAQFNNEFNRSVSVQNIHGLCKRNGWKNGRDTRIKAGNVPWSKGTKGICKPNKGSFKKGRPSYNHKPVGCERIRDDGYVWVKVAEPNKFRLKQLVEWEKHKGLIPDGMMIRFLDNDRTNCSIDNLMLVTRSVNAIVNNSNPANTGNPDLNEVILLTETLRSEANNATA